jgi:hypothetical protein
MPLSFPKLVHDVGRTPWSAADALVGLLVRISLIRWQKSGSRGTRPDPGVRPTSYPTNPSTGKLSDIGLKPAPPGPQIVDPKTWPRRFRLRTRRNQIFDTGY